MVLEEPDKGGTAVVRGKLEGLEDDVVTVIQDGNPERQLKIPFSTIRKTQLDG